GRAGGAGSPLPSPVLGRALEHLRDHDGRRSRRPQCCAREADRGCGMTAMHDTAAAVDFLKWWRPKGVLTLASIPPEGGNPTARSWEVSEASSAWADIAQWIDARQGR